MTDWREALQDAMDPVQTLRVGITRSLPLLATTACEGGLIPAHSWSIVSHEGYRTLFLSRRT